MTTILPKNMQERISFWKELMEKKDTEEKEKQEEEEPQEISALGINFPRVLDEETVPPFSPSEEKEKLDKGFQREEKESSSFSEEESSSPSSMALVRPSVPSPFTGEPVIDSSSTSYKVVKHTCFLCGDDFTKLQQHMPTNHPYNFSGIEAWDRPADGNESVKYDFMSRKIQARMVPYVVGMRHANASGIPEWVRTALQQLKEKARKKGPPKATTSTQTGEQDIHIPIMDLPPIQEGNHASSKKRGKRPASQEGPQAQENVMETPKKKKRSQPPVVGESDSFSYSLEVDEENDDISEAGHMLAGIVREHASAMVYAKSEGVTLPQYIAQNLSYRAVREALSLLKNNCTEPHFSITPEKVRFLWKYSFKL